jgi:2-hydroxy-3-oxopropionate reductase
VLGTGPETTQAITLLEAIALSKVGFIGPGIMGTPRAAHLIAGGHALFLYSRKTVQSGADRQRSGGVRVRQGGGRTIRHRLIMVPDTPDVGTVLFSETGVAPGLSKGKTVVDRSSISPIETKGYAARIEALGCD